MESYLLKLSQTHSNDIEFQIILSLTLGLLLAPFSWGLKFTFLFVVFFEIYVFLITYCYPPNTQFYDRLVINLFFFFGWILSRILFCHETGCQNFL
jgi:hypothetical protein